MKPEPLGGGVVALVEQGLEGFEDEGLILFGRGLVMSVSLRFG